VGAKGIPKEIANRLYSTFKKAFEENKDEISKLARGGEQPFLIEDGDELKRIYHSHSMRTRK